MTKLTEKETHAINLQVMVYWYRRLIAFTKIIDRLNTTSQPVIALVNEGLRRTCNEALGYITEITDIQEDMPAVVVPVKVYDADGKEVA